MNLYERCPDHDAPSRKCSSNRVLWDNKPALGMIATRINNNIRAVKGGLNIHELRYKVLMKRENILKKIYPPEQAIERLSSAIKQTGPMIRNKIEKNELWAMEGAE